MRTKISRFTSSLMSQLGSWLTESEIDGRTKEIRTAMVTCMLEVLGNQTTRPPVWNKVTYSTSIQALWYLRTELMAFLSEQCGETLASEKLATITEMFRGAVPLNQMSKPGRRPR